MMMKIFGMTSMLILSSAILSGCGLSDYYGIIGRPQQIQYRGINPEDKPADGSGPQYNTKWESQYTDGQYKREEKVEYTTDSESSGNDSFSNDRSSNEICEPTYSFSPPGDPTGDACIGLCYRRREKCNEDIRMKTASCEHFNAMARIEFGRCLASGAVDCYRNTHECSTEVPSDAESQCDEKYRFCYTSCGGSVSNSCDQ